MIGIDKRPEELGMPARRTFRSESGGRFAKRMLKAAADIISRRVAEAQRITYSDLSDMSANALKLRKRTLESASEKSEFSSLNLCGAAALREGNRTNAEAPRGKVDNLALAARNLRNARRRLQAREQGVVEQGGRNGLGSRNRPCPSRGTEESGLTQWAIRLPTIPPMRNGNTVAISKTPKEKTQRRKT